ncbi:acetyl-CoA carboxylase biotin carboxyl carrier protein [Neokomagataea thailandica NBRC 106555]|uniref:Acetyl-CoA carboxylase biotin carboxyl carrier protein subunit n=3 Tax=Acetobacteraceae TaxID=433 RepID=A0A4Y6V826_9PROT|nr:acetyl-CoA carboxylase biotin carboxyl carrier protein subunit [Neokomagataea tanensis]GBR52219.1 acetyl-CoA carboxylase biotin carboxyl carrier protein [Neokomagataea thailandica NBRC 106555]
MELDELARLITLMERGGISELQIEDNGNVLRLKSVTGSALCDVPPAKGVHPANIMMGVEKQTSTPQGAQPATPKQHVIKAETFGILHLMPSPDAAPYIVVGQDIVVGQQIGLIEAMKVFSPVKASHAGRVTEIAVSNGAEVEPGQPLVVLA